jgi:hypothetical protein
MANKTKIKIPIKDVDTGIRQSLWNANRINAMAKTILKSKKKIDLFTVRDHPNKYAVVLFYYALEEFGKAVYLSILKNNTQKGEKFIVAELYNHDKKMDEVKKHYPDLYIKKWKMQPLGKDRPSKFFTYIENGEIVSNFMERSSLWLVDYDERKSKWKEQFPYTEDDEISKMIKNLESEIENLLEKFPRKIKRTS